MPLKQKLASVYKKIMKITLLRKLNKIELQSDQSKLSF